MVASLAAILLSFFKDKHHSWVIMLAIALVDCRIPEYYSMVRPGIQSPTARACRVSKDVGAAAVLIAALTSIVIGLLILGPPLWSVIRSWF
jgi:diacylglycerol kinase